jgi:hypothetical protein
MPARDIIAFPSRSSSDQKKKVKASKSSQAELSRNAVFSFLKDTRGMLSWTARDLAKTLDVTLAQANEGLPILEMQGYVKRSGGEWLTTLAGEEVSGSAAPRFRREAVEQALMELRERIRKLNADRNAQASVARAVAYGDFLSDRARVQAADVGIEIKAPRGATKPLLTMLRAKSAMLHLHAFEAWMVERTHRKLI